MKKLIIVFILTFLFLSCKKNKNKVVTENQCIELADSIPKQEYTGGALYCEKIMRLILEESKKWPVNYEFEKQDWLIKDGTHSTDFDIIPYVQKEVHFYAKDIENPFSKIEVDYYILENEEIAKKIIEDYSCDLSNIGNSQDSIFYSRAYIKIPTYLYRFGSTVLQVRTDNGVAHIVANALSDFNEQEKIHQNDAVPYLEPRKNKNTR